VESGIFDFEWAWRRLASGIQAARICTLHRCGRRFAQPSREPECRWSTIHPSPNAWSPITTKHQYADRTSNRVLKGDFSNFECIGAGKLDRCINLQLHQQCLVMRDRSYNLFPSLNPTICDARQGIKGTIFSTQQRFAHWLVNPLFDLPGVAQPLSDLTGVSILSWFARSGPSSLWLNREVQCSLWQGG